MEEADIEGKRMGIQTVRDLGSWRASRGTFAWQGGISRPGLELQTTGLIVTKLISSLGI